jgi:Protein of unknown function (DUF3562)
MNWPQLDDQTEQKKHRQSVENLAGYLDMPRERVVAVYEQELVLMGRIARIRDYLPILVSRRVKRLLRS